MLDFPWGESPAPFLLLGVTLKVTPSGNHLSVFSLNHKSVRFPFWGHFNNDLIFSMFCFFPLCLIKELSDVFKALLLCFDHLLPFCHFSASQLQPGIWN